MKLKANPKNRLKTGCPDEGNDCLQTPILSVSRAGSLLPFGITASPGNSGSFNFATDLQAGF